MIRVIKHEWHQVDSEYEMTLEREELDTIYPDLSDEERDDIWQQILDNNYEYHQLIEDASDQSHYIDWEHCNDDWWTHRKGGYDITYEVETDYEPPKTDEQRMTDLRNEVNELCKQLGLEERYDTRPAHIRLQEIKAEFDRLVEEE